MERWGKLLKFDRPDRELMHARSLSSQNCTCLMRDATIQGLQSFWRLRLCLIMMAAAFSGFWPAWE
jgi:hypothetical protein